MTKAGRPSLGFRQRILASSNRFWEPAELGSSPSTATHLLSELTQAGELRRIRRGLYWRGTKTVLGMSPPTPANLVNKLTGGIGYGPTGLSAALALGLSTQVPRIETYAIPGRKPEGIANIDLRTRPSRRGRIDARLRPNEIALLEILNDWDSLVEIPRQEAKRRINALLAAGTLDRARLRAAATSEPQKVQQLLREFTAA